MANYLEVIFFSLVGGVFSLVGGLALLSRKRLAESIVNNVIPFAAGALLGAAFFDLLPEAIDQTADGAASRWVLVGIVIFFLLEHFLHWFHHHSDKDDSHLTSAAPLIVVGDTIHNFIDGVAIGAAFLLSVPTGIITALAVAAHEIPQEIGDFGLLLKAGYAKQRVITINILSALATVVGAVPVFWLGGRIDLPVGELLAITAGFFIYIAASDLIPAIHEESKQRFGRYAAALLILGILVVAVATEAAHEYIDAEHSRGIETKVNIEQSQTDSNNHTKIDIKHHAEYLAKIDL